MKKVLFISFFLFLGASVYAQTAETTKPAVKKEEVGNSETKEAKKEVVKTVPASKENNASPRRVDKPAKKGARPSELRPARNPRPVNRNNRPGRG